MGGRGEKEGSERLEKKRAAARHLQLRVGRKEGRRGEKNRSAGKRKRMCLYQQIAYACGHVSHIRQLSECTRIRDQLYRINHDPYHPRRHPHHHHHHHDHQNAHAHRNAVGNQAKYRNHLPFQWPADCQPSNANIRIHHRREKCPDCTFMSRWRFFGYGGWT